MPNIQLHQWLLGACASTSFVLAYLSYQYLALKMFRMGSMRLVEITTVPEQCRDAVAYTAAAFGGIFDYVSFAAAGIFIVLGVYLVWRAITTQKHEM